MKVWLLEYYQLITLQNQSDFELTNLDKTMYFCNKIKYFLYIIEFSNLVKTKYFYNKIKYFNLISKFRKTNTIQYNSVFLVKN